MASFKYCEVKFFKEQDTSSLDNPENTVDKGKLKNANRQVRISFFQYNWSEDQFEKKCLEMLESFQKRHLDFEIIDGCLDFSKDEEVSLSFVIAYEKKMIKSQMRSLKQELTFLVQSSSEEEDFAEAVDGSLPQTDSEMLKSVEMLKKSYEELKVSNEKSCLFFEKSDMNDEETKVLLHQLSEKTDRQIGKLYEGMNSLVALGEVNKVQIAELEGKISLKNNRAGSFSEQDREAQQKKISEGNQKLLVKFDYLLQTVERLESRMINDQKKIIGLQETQQKMLLTFDSFSTRIKDYLIKEGGQQIGGNTGNKEQQLSKEVAMIKQAMDGFKENQAEEENGFPRGRLNEARILSDKSLGSQNSLNYREIQINEQQENAIANQTNPLAKEHQVCKELFLSSNSERSKNKKIKVNKEEFLAIINSITFCEFNWSNVSSQFSEELFRLYKLPDFQEPMEYLSSFLDQLNLNDFTIPFVSKNILFVDKSTWNQLQGYKLLNQYLEHILNEHGLLVK